MVLKGVKAQFAKDKSTVTTWAYPSKAGYDYKLTKKTWKNACPLCKSVSHYKTAGKLKWNPKKVPEGELTCSQCGADFCAVSGKDKNKKVRGKLTPATVTTNSATKVASSQTQSQYCSLSKAEALTQAKEGLNTQSTYAGTLKIPIMKNINLGDLININLTGFDETKKKTLYIDKITENIDEQTYEISLLEGPNHLSNTYEGSYLMKNKNGGIITTNSDNPLNAKCQIVNTNIGLKDSSSISKKIKLKGQQLGTVPKIYKWLKIKSAGGTGGWKYKNYNNHIVSSENVDKFGPKSAQKCWSNKTANCTDFAWIMSMMGKGAGKKVGVKKGTYTTTTGKEKGHMWNYYGSKYYDCSNNEKLTIDWKKVETL